MLIFLILLLPILIAGILILRKTTSVRRIELILPAGSILGLTFFAFALNTLAFLVKGQLGIIGAYLLTVCLGFSLNFIKSKNDTLLLQGKQLFFWLASILGWSGLIFWKASHALIGSDTNLYYGIAHSFIRGNFPALTPWQPDLPLAYHLGVFEVLGAFYSFTGLDFHFLHLFFSSLFIICSVQIIIWIWVRHKDLLSFTLANLTGLVAFISFGFFYLVLPKFPISLPHINNFNELIIILRNLPTVNQSIEVYGAPINLDGLIYFIFHAFGIAIFLATVTILIDQEKRPLITWATLAICLLTLALVNESIFVATAPALIVGLLLVEKNRGTLSRNILPLIFFGALTLLTILLQGGVITSTIFPPGNIENSTIIFPRKEDIKEDFIAYHYYQEISKTLSLNKEWLFLNWFHVGVDLLLLVSILMLLNLRVERRQSVLLISLSIAGFTSLIFYNILVPRFLAANGNRFLSFSFLIFSLVICLCLTHLISETKRNNSLKKILLTVFILWLFIPTIIPPLALLSKTRFGENMLKPKLQQSSEGISWIKENLPYNSRLMVLDSRSPHPSGMARAIVGAGVFAPIFPGEFRAYTIEASPEYMDAAYFLSPLALKKLNADTLLIDDAFFETLPNKRKQQLENGSYFEKKFDNSLTRADWEKVYKIKNEYLINGSEMDGTIERLTRVFSKKGKIYIDNEENFSPSFLRRAIIFSLRNKDIYYLPQSGVYLNVETNINSHPPLEDGSYDYLVLSKKTEPGSKCSCHTKLIWVGIKDEVYVWKKNETD